jgi:hypothetical protein
MLPPPPNVISDIHASNMKLLRTYNVPGSGANIEDTETRKIFCLL